MEYTQFQRPHSAKLSYEGSHGGGIGSAYEYIYGLIL